MHDEDEEEEEEASPQARCEKLIEEERPQEEQKSSRRTRKLLLDDEDDEGVRVREREKEKDKEKEEKKEERRHAIRRAENAAVSGRRNRQLVSNGVPVREPAAMSHNARIHSRLRQHTVDEERTEEHDCSRCGYRFKFMNMSYLFLTGSRTLGLNASELVAEFSIQDAQKGRVEKQSLKASLASIVC